MAAVKVCQVCGKLKGREGYGTSLKPAWEPVIVARKPLEGTVAANVLKYGTGAINVDGCRIPRDPDDVSGWSASGSNESENRSMSGKNYNRAPKPDADGRWPANVIPDGSDEVVGLFPDRKVAPRGKPTIGLPKSVGASGIYFSSITSDIHYEEGNGGSAARFFYCAKASKRDRGEGNIHPTVKPTDLMRYLCRLVTPPGGVVLDPFMGSGSTGKAAILESFQFIGIEREAEYLAIAEARIKAISPVTQLSLL